MEKNINKSLHWTDNLLMILFGITLKTDKAMYGGRIQDSGYLWVIMTGRGQEKGFSGEKMSECEGGYTDVFIS